MLGAMAARAAVHAGQCRLCGPLHIRGGRRGERLDPAPPSEARARGAGQAEGSEGPGRARRCSRGSSRVLHPPGGSGGERGRLGRGLAALSPGAERAGTGAGQCPAGRLVLQPAGAAAPPPRQRRAPAWGRAISDLVETMGRDRFMRPKLLPVLEPGAVPQRATWYTLVPLGESPSARVGHNCLYLPPVPTAGKGKVVIVGGADPNGSFSDAHIIDLDRHQWAMPGWVGLLPRYEHATFIPTSSPTSLWVFGGADQSGNRNCVQVLNLETGIWESPKVTGTQPLPRTFHTSSAAIGDRLYVLGGGDKGAEPVKDPQLHVFDTATLTWSQPEVHGNPPSPRHGHVVVAVGTKLFIHGGLSGDKFYNDLFCIDTKDMRWEKLPAAGDVPGGRAAHSAAAFGDHLYIFGGMDPTGALDTMYKYHIENQQWTLLEFDSPLPPGRLDHSMCIVPWQVCVNVKNRDSAVTSRNTIGKEATETVSDEGDSDQKKQIGKDCTEDKLMYLFLIFGGMDTQGEIHRDCIVNLIK